MTNSIGYNQYPKKDEFIELYQTGKSQRELAEFYGCTKVRIKKWIEHFDLVVRPPGGGNNRKFDHIDIEYIQNILNQKQHSLASLSSSLNMTEGSTQYLLSKFGLKLRDKDKYTDYKKYKLKVRRLTEQQYAKHFEKINPYKYPRCLCGVADGYQLDHILSVFECYHSGVSPEKCASYENLQMIPWKENLKKRVFTL